MAKSKKMFFVFIPKGSDGTLLVSKKKIPTKEIAEAKKAIGGGTPITGKCFGPIANMVFQVAKPAPPTLAPAIKKVAKRDTGLMVVPAVQLAADADAEEPEEKVAAAAGAGAAAPPAGAAAAAPAAPPAPAGQAKVMGIQKALQKLGYDPGTLDGIDGPHTQAAVKKFQQDHGLAVDGIAGPQTQAALAKALQGAAAAGGGAKPAAAQPPPKAPAVDAQAAAIPKPKFNLAPWQSARQKAITDLKSLAAKVVGTKHGSAPDVLKEINFIITKLPASPSPNEVDKLAEFIRTDDTIAAAHEVPKHFHDLNIRDPLLKALEAMKQLA
jgi:hypothetical protein